MFGDLVKFAHPLSRNSRDPFLRFDDLFRLSKSFLDEHGLERQINVDVSETDEQYIIQAAVPGIKKEDISLDLRDGILTITANQQTEKNEENGNYILKELHTDNCSRSFSVPSYVETDPSAELKEGILTIAFKKTTGKQNRIEIK